MSLMRRMVYTKTKQLDFINQEMMVSLGPETLSRIEFLWAYDRDMYVDLELKPLDKKIEVTEEMII